MIRSNFNKTISIFFLIIGIVFFADINIAACRVFSTWETFETDKLASIWLLKRFVDNDAKIKLFPKGKTITTGIPFDVPGAKIRRYQNFTTFQFMLNFYHLNDKKLISIGKIIHDIEINIWENKVFNETHDVQNSIFSIITDSGNSDEIIKKACRYFDLLYDKIPVNLTPAN